MNKKSSSLLEVMDVEKRFNGKESSILKSVNLSLGKGEIAGLAGNSGSGKTTLLRIIAALEEPTQGDVFFRGARVPGPADTLVPGHPEIRLVHQHFELAHRLSVFDNVAQKLRHLRREEQEGFTRELLQICRLLPLAEKMVEVLSGGEKQRLALARALAEEPEILLLDEPFSNLDPHLKESIRQELFQYIRQSGISAVLVSHDPKDALSLTDKIWVLNQGELVQTGSPMEVYYKPASPEVGELFGQLNICRLEELKPFLNGKALENIQELKRGTYIGIRPELVSPIVDLAEADLKATVKAVVFHGAYTEVGVALSPKLDLYFFIAPFFNYHIGEPIGLHIQWQHLQVW